jgi:MFS family permease
MINRTFDRTATESDIHHGDGRSVTDLIRDLRDESLTLMRQEFALAKTEMSEKASRAGRNLGYLGVGGGIAFASALLLAMALAAGLYVALVAMDVSHETAGWLAPLLVGAILAAIGYSLIQKALTALRQESVIPERTVETLKDDKEWAQEKIQEKVS